MIVFYTVTMFWYQFLMIGKKDKKYWLYSFSWYCCTKNGRKRLAWSRQTIKGIFTREKLIISIVGSIVQFTHSHLIVVYSSKKKMGEEAF